MNEILKALMPFIVLIAIGILLWFGIDIYFWNKERIMFKRFERIAKMRHESFEQKLPSYNKLKEIIDKSRKP